MKDNKETFNYINKKILEDVLIDVVFDWRLTTEIPTYL